MPGEKSGFTFQALTDIIPVSVEQASPLEVFNSATKIFTPASVAKEKAVGRGDKSSLRCDRHGQIQA
ncbi:MAG: hypothetical protein OXB86_06000 [Bdellovibrionales bacterium]|nr:hypothetical protein [Bdellovibrionales bacterium]